MNVIAKLLLSYLILSQWMFLKCVGQSFKDDFSKEPSLNSYFCRQPLISSDVEYRVTSPYRIQWDSAQYWPGSRINFFCTDQDQTLVGKPSMYCDESGNWIPSTTPICFDKSNFKVCSAPVIKNGRWQCAAQGCRDEFNSGTQVKIACNSGTKLVGNPLIKCAQGRWSPELPRCVPNHKTCPHLSVMPHGNFRCITQNCLEFGIRAMLAIECDKGYGLTGGGTLSCRADGTWSSELPNCIAIPEKTCSMPLQIPNGEWEIDNFTIGHPMFFEGASVNYRCDPGYRLVGEPKLVCENGGQWSSYPPTCSAEVHCPDPGIINNGRFECARLSDFCSDYTVGIRLVFVCDDGFRGEGENEIQCMEDGQWSEGRPSCLKVPYSSSGKSSGPFGSTTTIVIATACSVLGVLMVLMLIVVTLHRRRPASQLTHQIHPPPPAYSQTYTPPSPPGDPDQNHDRLALIAYDGISLPSYEEVVSASRTNRPRANHHRPLVDSTSRQSLVTNSTGNRDTHSAFGSMDTVNQSTANLSTHASTDNTSTSVTVETYDSSGASVPSAALSSRRAVAGSLASTSDTSSVYKEEAPLLEVGSEISTPSQEVELEDFKID